MMMAMMMRMHHLLQPPQREALLVPWYVVIALTMPRLAYSSILVLLTRYSLA